MSVLIKGMEMPKPGAYTCELGVLDDNTAVLTIYTPINEPQKSYTLIPVQTHGRLIDADAMIHDIEKSAPMCSSWYVKERNADMIKFLSIEDTVIPAEEGE